MLMRRKSWTRLKRKGRVKKEMKKKGRRMKQRWKRRMKKRRKIEFLSTYFED